MTERTEKRMRKSLAVTTTRRGLLAFIIEILEAEGRNHKLKTNQNSAKEWDFKHFMIFLFDDTLLY
jgi:hypothetical protein